MSPGVNTQVIDLTTRIPSFPGVYGGINLPALKGPVGRTLISSESQLLDLFTPDSRIEIGFNLAYFSAITFLRASNKLWINRVIKPNAHYGGLSIFDSSQVDSLNSPWSVGVTSPSRSFQNGQALDIYASNVGAWASNIGIRLYGKKDNETLNFAAIHRDEAFYSLVDIGEITTGYFPTVPAGFTTGDPVKLVFRGREFLVQVTDKEN